MNLQAGFEAKEGWVLGDDAMVGNLTEAALLFLFPKLLCVWGVLG